MVGGVCGICWDTLFPIGHFWEVYDKETVRQIKRQRETERQKETERNRKRQREHERYRDRDRDR